MPVDVEAWRQGEIASHRQLEDSLLERMTDLPPNSEDWQSAAQVRGFIMQMRLRWLGETS